MTLDFSDWPGVVDMAEGWFNQPIPAKTATMWYAELRHYETGRVIEAIGRVVRSHQSPFLPPLGLILTTLRADGQGTPLDALAPATQRFIRSTDQFLLTEGGSSTNEEGDPHDDDVLASGLICATAGCGYTPVLAISEACPLCGGRFVPDGYVLAQGPSGAAA